MISNDPRSGLTKSPPDRSSLGLELTKPEPVLKPDGLLVWDGWSLVQGDRLSIYTLCQSRALFKGGASVEADRDLHPHRWYRFDSHDGGAT